MKSLKSFFQFGTVIIIGFVIISGLLLSETIRSKPTATLKALWLTKIAKISPEIPLPKTKNNSLEVETKLPTSTNEVVEISVPSLSDINNTFAPSLPEDLEQQVVQSQLQIQKLKLIEKSNVGLLNEAENAQLLLELRKQAVLNQLITKAKVDELRRKYL